MPRRLEATSCIALFAGVLGVAWWPFLAGRKSPFVRDIEFYHHPVTLELVSAWSEGRIPLWTDRVFCGFPFFADSQTAAWYPGTLLPAALGPHHGYVLFVLLHALLAAVGTFLWVRSHGGVWPAAVAAGLIVPMSGFYAYEIEHPGLFAILCWLPVWLFAARAVFVRPTPARIAAAALPLAMMAFAGTLQVLFGAALLLAFYLAGLAIEQAHSRGLRGVIGGIAAVALAQVLAMLLAAVVLLPTFAHFPATARGLGMTYAAASLGSVHPLQLLGMFVGAPTQWGGKVGGDFAGASFYTGVLTLPLALTALFAARRGLALALWVAIAWIGVLAAGRYGGLHPLLYEWMPGAVGALRGMGRALGPGVVGLALLAGLGLQGLRERNARHGFAGLLAFSLAVHAGVHAFTAIAPETVGSAAVLAVALLLCRLVRTRPALLQAGVAALLAIDLLWLGAHRQVLERSPPPPRAEQVAGAIHFPALVDIAQGRFGGKGDRFLLLGFGAGAGNFAFHHQLDGVGGYNQLVTLRYLDFASLANRGQIHPREPLGGFVHQIVPGLVHSGLFDAAAIRFVISAVPLPWEGMRLLERYGAHPLTRRPVLVYENERALPRAFLAYRTVRAEGPQALPRWLGPDFDPRVLAVFEGDAPALDGPPGITPLEPIRPRPELLRFEVAPERAALLVVADAWHPGWRAFVDGTETPVVRVNALFRGVPIGPDARRVEMRFEPWTLRLGAAVSAAAALVLVLAWAPRGLRGVRRIW